MFARDPETKELFQSHWNEMVTRRGYLAVVEGTPKPDRGVRRGGGGGEYGHLLAGGQGGVEPGDGHAVHRHQPPGQQGFHIVLSTGISWTFSPACGTISENQEIR